MSLIILSTIILVGAYLAGLFGSLTGLGGGVVIIPLLTLLLKVDIHYAIGSSLVAVIATSSGSAAVYIKERITNIRLGIFLEIATTLGAIIGALIASYFDTNDIAVFFGILLIFSVLISLKKRAVEHVDQREDLWAERLKLNSSYPTSDGVKSYKVSHIRGGFGMMTFAGILSGLFGVGSGALKVIAMDSIMHIPFKVSTTTSNFMIGVTAVASAVIYFQRGYIDPVLSAPVVVGVLAGSFTGSRILVEALPKYLRIIFVVVVFFLSIQMIYNGFIGGI
ncbi:MAG: sulfite exporter TauE/SafE family protein [Flavobacteriales bacterium AspAUS03]